MKNDQNNLSHWYLLYPLQVTHTGASRGIGLELVNQLLKDVNNKVIAAARSPASSPLAAINNQNLFLVTMDITNEDSIKVTTCH